MSDDIESRQGRRHFVGLGILGLALAPLGGLVVARPAHARGGGIFTGPSTQIPALPENDRQAAALYYREDASTVDVSRYARAEGGTCRNCQLYSGADDDEWGPCAIFSFRQHPTLNANYVVSARGWCKSWGPRGA